VLTARVVRYRRERWLTPGGETIVAPLPSGIRGHPRFRGGMLWTRATPLCADAVSPGSEPAPAKAGVTVGRLVTLLQAIGVSISKRQSLPRSLPPGLTRRKAGVMRLLIDRQDDFLTETREVLRAGLETADWVTVDDTGARHRGANGVCTHMWTAPSLQGLCSALIRSLAFICPACLCAHA
jgi:hypothetical protein